MDNYNAIIIEELKSINRKLERLDDKIERSNLRTKHELRLLEEKFDDDLGPIKKHVTQVKLISVLVGMLLPAAITIHRLFT